MEHRIQKTSVKAGVTLAAALTAVVVVGGGQAHAQASESVSSDNAAQQHVNVAGVSQADLATLGKSPLATALAAHLNGDAPNKTSGFSSVAPSN
ncbi:hypothetical protein ACFYWN_42875 [Streptomyces sp. NPDC002917]|uniref:hypothetical protein n=1 Tax=Streptomyces sp. NPDC002917 TaxID=3364671 RepID=UPI0036C933AA